MHLLAQELTERKVRVFFKYYCLKNEQVELK